MQAYVYPWYYYLDGEFDMTADLAATVMSLSA